MILTLESAKRLVNRLHKMLNAPAGSTLYATLADTKELFAQAAGCTNWQQIDAFLGTGNTDAQTPDFNNYANATVHRAIAKSLGDPTDAWAARAVVLLDTVYAASASAFISNSGIRQLLGFDWLEQQQDVPQVKHYFTALPNYSSGDRAGAKTLHNHLVAIIECALENWDLLLAPEHCTVPPPVTCDVLMRCIEQHVDWAPKWIDWFKTTHA